MSVENQKKCRVAICLSTFCLNDRTIYAGLKIEDEQKSGARRQGYMKVTDSRSSGSRK
jgi:hypothetical protein